MSKTNKPRITPLNGGSGTTAQDDDVPGEDLPITELIKITEEDRPAKVVLKFRDQAMKIIADKKAEYGKLVITGVDDKEGYNAVKAAMAEMKSSRIVFDKAAGEHISGPLKKIVEEVNEGIEAIITGFKEVEADLRTKKNAIDDEKERLKELERQAAIKRVQERTVKLVEMGAISDGMVYSFYYSQMLYVTATDVHDWTEERFNEFMADVKVAFEKEEERKIKAAEEKMAEYERQLAEQKQAEEARIEEENNRILRQAALEKQVEQQSEETRALRLRIGNLRKKEIRMLGGVEQEDETFTFEGKPFHLAPMETMVDMPDDEWERMMAGIESYTPPKAEPAPQAADERLPSEAAAPVRNYPLTEAEATREFIESVLEEEPNVGLVELTMRFFTDEPYTDIAITARRTMRFYPEEFAKEANAGVEALASYRVQYLYCIIFDNLQE